MATFRKRGSSWQAIINRNGVYKSGSFPTKPEAEKWALKEEALVLDERNGNVPRGKTFGDLLMKYKEDVVSKKAGEKWEGNRIDRIVREEPIANVVLSAFDAKHARAWADKRLAEVKVNSVLREWTILTHACKCAMKPDWGWLKHNPFTEIDRPESPESRDRVPTEDETERVLYTLGCDPDQVPQTKTARVGFAYLFALETAMREGEIAGLRWVDVVGQVARLGTQFRKDGKRNTKNGHAREVPLFPEAVALLEKLKEVPREKDDDLVFQLTAAQIDALFRKARTKAAIEDLHFHDTRRAALTKMATPVEEGGRGIDVLTLAKISGHRDLQILLNTYYAPKMQAIADRFHKPSAPDPVPQKKGGSLRLVVKH